MAKSVCLFMFVLLVVGIQAIQQSLLREQPDGELDVTFWFVYIFILVYMKRRDLTPNRPMSHFLLPPTQSKGIELPVVSSTNIGGGIHTTIPQLPRFPEGRNTLQVCHNCKSSSSFRRVTPTGTYRRIPPPTAIGNS